MSEILRVTPEGIFVWNAAPALILRALRKLDLGDGTSTDLRRNIK